MNWIADPSRGSACLIILTDFSGEACGLGTQRGPSRAVYSSATDFRVTVARSLICGTQNKQDFQRTVKNFR